MTSGALVDDGQAWAVVTGNGATTRYDTYGFNSFATIGGKQYGLKPTASICWRRRRRWPAHHGGRRARQARLRHAGRNLAAVRRDVSTGKMLLRVGDPEIHTISSNGNILAQKRG